MIEPRPDTSPSPASPPWFQRLAHVADGCLRPGGTELTRRLAGCLPRNSQVLDLGCGCGASLGLLRGELGHEAMGLDLSGELLSRCRGDNTETPLVMASAEALPLRDQCMDAVLCECVLSLMPRLGAVVKQAHRVLKPGGRILVSDLYSRAAHTCGPGQPTGPRCCLDGARTRRKWLEVFHESGFSVDCWEDHTKALAKLSGQLIFTYGSMESFWRALLPEDRAREAMGRSRDIKPGYFVMTATKR